MTDRPMYYDFDGEPISMMESALLFQARGDGIEGAEVRWRVGLYEEDGISVSTVWLGLDHGYGRSERPLIFETLAYGPDGQEVMERYSTAEEALDGHESIVRRMKALAELELWVRR